MLLVFVWFGGQGVQQFLTGGFIGFSIAVFLRQWRRMHGRSELAASRRASFDGGDPAFDCPSWLGLGLFIINWPASLVYRRTTWSDFSRKGSSSNRAE
ncbi:MAG: hypothetical protein K7J47_14020 [Acidobacteria bacterium]|nr:hypothetical protein [Bryobacteraceae bacterium CoA2 C42]